MNIGVIFAGGAGRRMHSKDKPKQFLEMYGKPIIIYTLEYFDNCDDINAVVIACIDEWKEYLKGLLYKYRISKVEKIVSGGETGQLSIYNGLCAVKEIEYTDETIVLIHDGVRPLITSELLSRNIDCVKKNGTSITAGAVTETIVEIDDEGKVKLVPERKYSRVAKAPQCFYLKDILEVHEKALSEGKTDYIDSCTIMKAYGKELYLLDGPAENIKITTPEDFYIMRAIMDMRENAQLYMGDTDS